MNVCQDVCVCLVCFSFGDGKVVDDDIGEFYLAHDWRVDAAHAFNIIHNSSEK